jgi:hypothetical protein
MAQLKRADITVDATRMDPQPPNHQRQCHRLTIAAKVHASLWLLPDDGGNMVIPAKRDLITAAVHNLSATGMAVALHRSDFARLPINVADQVGLTVECAGERLVCAAGVRHIKDIGDDILRLGLGFNFDPADMSQRCLARKFEKIVASLGRAMLRRRAYYGTPTPERA